MISTLTSDPLRVRLAGVAPGRYLVRRLMPDGWEGGSTMEAGSIGITLEFGPYDVVLVSFIGTYDGSHDNRLTNAAGRNTT